MPQKYILPHLANAIFPPDEHALHKDNLATGNKSLLTPHRSMMEKCCSCFMDTKYKCLRCTHKMAFNSKSTPSSSNLQRTTYYFVQKKIWQ